MAPQATKTGDLVGNPVWHGDLRKHSLRSFALFSCDTMSLRRLLLFLVVGWGAVEAQATDYSSRVMASEPLLYWSFDEADGPAEDQVSLLANRALVSNAPTRVAHYPMGQAASLGTLDRRFRADALGAGTVDGPFAVEFWMRTSNPAYQYLMKGSNDTGAPIIHYSNASEAKEQVCVVSGGTLATGLVVAPDGLWHHVVLVDYDDGQMEGYVDGVPGSMPGASAAMYLDLRDIFTVGTSGGGDNPFQGEMDEIAIYDLAGLDATEIKAKGQSIASHSDFAGAGYRIVQISDTQPPPDQPGRWDKIGELVETVNSLEPAFVIFAGDITHSGTDEEFKRIAELLSGIESPVHYIPGNHDTIEPANESEAAMSAAELREERLRSYGEYFGPERWSFEHGDFQFVGFDCTDNWPDLTAGQTQWLTEALSSSKRPYKFVVTHYTHADARNKTLDQLLASVGAVGYMHGHNHAVEAYRDKGTGRLVFSSGTGSQGVMYHDVRRNSLSSFWKGLDGETEALGVFDLAEARAAVLRRADVFYIRPYIQNLTPNEVTIKYYTRSASGAAVALRGQDEDDWEKKDFPEDVASHEVKLDQLVGGTCYDYCVEVDTAEFGRVRSQVVSFETPEAEADSVTFAVYGDSRTFANEHHKIASAIAKRSEEGLDFCVHTGDITTNGRVFAGWAREFFEPAAELLARIPLYPVLGNHELDSEYYFDFFALEGNERWYSFDRGGVHFIFLDSYSPLEPDSKQYEWLKADLVNCDSVWKVMSLHTPFFSSGPHGRLNEEGKPGDKEMADLQEHILPLVEAYDVTMVFVGHDHLYERSKKGDTYFIISGGGGAPLYDVSKNLEQNPYSEVLRAEHHYAVVEASVNKFDLTVYNGVGDVIDELRLSKPVPANAEQGIAK